MYYRIEREYGNMYGRSEEKLETCGDCRALFGTNFSALVRNAHDSMRPAADLLYLLFTNRLEQAWVVGLLYPCAQSLTGDGAHVLAAFAVGWWLSAAPVALVAGRLGRARALLPLAGAKLGGYTALSVACLSDVGAPVRRALLSSGAFLLGAARLASAPLHGLTGDRCAAAAWVHAYKWLGLTDFACDVAKGRLLAVPLAMAGVTVRVAPLSDYASVWQLAAFDPFALDGTSWSRVWQCVGMLGALGSLPLLWQVDPRAAVSATHRPHERRALSPLALVGLFLVLHELTALGRAHGDGVRLEALRAAVARASWAWFAGTYVAVCALLIPWLHAVAELRHGASFMACGAAAQLVLLTLGSAFSARREAGGALGAGSEPSAGLVALPPDRALDAEGALLLCLTWVAIVLYYPQLRTFLQQTVGPRAFCAALLAFEALDEHLNQAVLLPWLARTASWRRETTVPLGQACLAVAGASWALWAWAARRHSFGEWLGEPKGSAGSIV
jgi:hypothetical protein